MDEDIIGTEFRISKSEMQIPPSEVHLNHETLRNILMSVATTEHIIETSKRTLRITSGRDAKTCYFSLHSLVELRLSIHRYWGLMYDNLVDSYSGDRQRILQVSDEVVCEQICGSCCNCMRDIGT